VTVTVGLTEDGFCVQDDGTGLDLSIVKTIAEAHGWSLCVDGTYEGDARFVFATEERIFEKSAFTWDYAVG